MRRMDAKHIERASSRLGEAALDPGLWPEIMEDICRATGTSGAVLLQSDVRTPDVPRTAAFNECISNYFAQGWHTHDLRVRGVPLLLTGAPVITDQDFVTPEEMRSHPYYQDILRPYGFEWFAGVGFRADAALWVLCLQRTPREGPFEHDAKQMLGELSQRLTEAATLSTAVGRLAIAGMSDALDAVSHAALAVDRGGAVLGTNAAADQFFDDDIRVSNRRLLVSDRQAQRSLDALLDELHAAPDTKDLPVAPIVVRRGEKRPLLIRAIPISGVARSPFLGARAVLTLTTLAPRSGPNPTLLVSIFGLTTAEAKLASLIGCGVALYTAAIRLGIARETARNQLKAVFAKTDTHRQSELVALLSQLR